MSKNQTVWEAHEQSRQAERQKAIERGDVEPAPGDPGMPSHSEVIAKAAKGYERELAELPAKMRERQIQDSGGYERWLETGSEYMTPDDKLKAALHIVTDGSTRADKVGQKMPYDEAKDAAAAVTRAHPKLARELKRLGHDLQDPRVVRALAGVRRAGLA